MRSVFDTNTIFENYINKVIILEVSEGTMRKVIERFKQEPDVPDEQVMRVYINAFDRVRNSPRFAAAIANLNIEKKDIKNIELYTWRELESVLDSIGAISTENTGGKTDTGEKVYSDDSVEIWRGDNGRQCAYIVHDVIAPHVKDTDSISWCVARKNLSTNLYTNYRFKETKSTFYFVLCKKRHTAYAIQVTGSGKYIYTGSKNAGDILVDWYGLVNVIPELQNKQQYLKHKEYTQDELNQYAIKNATPDSFSSLSQEQKKAYIDLGKLILADDFNILSKDLQSHYINLRFDDSPFNAINNLFHSYNYVNDVTLNSIILILNIDHIVDLVKNKIVPEAEAKTQVKQWAFKYIQDRFPTVSTASNQASNTFIRNIFKYRDDITTKIKSSFENIYKPSIFDELPLSAKLSTINNPNLFITKSSFSTLDDDQKIQYINSRKRITWMVFIFSDTAPENFRVDTIAKDNLLEAKALEAKEPGRGVKFIIKVAGLDGESSKITTAYLNRLRELINEAKNK